LLLTTLWGFIQSWIEKSMDVNRNGKIELDQKGMAARMLGFSSPRNYRA
jgi:hypothetical protein